MTLNNNYVLQEAVYIPSIEASDIWLHNNFNQRIYIKYVGMIPSSMELESLFKHGFSISPKGKRTSNDIINISFEKSVKPVSDSISKLNVSLVDNEKQLKKYVDMAIKFKGKMETERINNKIDRRTKSIERIKSAITKLESTHWDEMGIEDLRYAIYEDDGFSIEYRDKDENVIDKIEYIISSRSSAKSRIGKVLAIRKELYEGMKYWRRMGLSFDGRKDLDFVSILAYESLMGSSLIDTIKIDPKNILIIEDYVDTFEREANLVSVDDKTKLLINKKGMGKFNNIIWDGQALLSEEYFADTKMSMKLLRQHWFKAAAFRCNIKEFMMERAIELDIDFETWVLVDVYGNTILAKDVHMITTPSALKFQKVAHVVGSKKDMYEHWIKCVNTEGNLFGIVKTEKSTKLGRTEDGKPIQVMSYQYLNSLPINSNDLMELAQFELNYIDMLKNDESVFQEYIKSTADLTNGNDMIAALYKHNPNIVGTKMFREWKKDKIINYVKRVKMGKLKIPNSDYMVLISNPIEMLYASVGMFKGEVMALSGQQVYCKAFDWHKPLIGMRSPHTSMSNVLSSICTPNDIIDKYLPNLTKNIVVINNIDATVFERLQGADADSDTMWMSDQPILARIAQECDRDYLVCKGDVKTDTKPYTVCNKDMAAIDNQLKNDFIGKVTNIAALLSSHIWNFKEKGKPIDSMLDKLSVLSIMQGLVIDYAKRIPAISIKAQITSANKLLSELLKDDKQIPKWWKIRNMDIIKQEAKKRKKEKSKNQLVVPVPQPIESDIKKEEEYIFYCPMDYLYNTFHKLPNANEVKNVEIQTFIRTLKAGKANNKQRHIISDLLDDVNNKVKSSHVKEVDDDKKRELHINRLDTAAFTVELLSKIKINEDTMYSIIQNIVENKVDNSTIRSFGMLYNAKKTLFLNSFIKK